MTRWSTHRTKVGSSGWHQRKRASTELRWMDDYSSGGVVNPYSLEWSPGESSSEGSVSGGRRRRRKEESRSLGGGRVDRRLPRAASTGRGLRGRRRRRKEDSRNLGGGRIDRRLPQAASTGRGVGGSRHWRKEESSSLHWTRGRREQALERHSVRERRAPREAESTGLSQKKGASEEGVLEARQCQAEGYSSASRRAGPREEGSAGGTIRVTRVQREGASEEGVLDGLHGRRPPMDSKEGHPMDSIGGGLVVPRGRLLQR